MQCLAPSLIYPSTNRTKVLLHFATQKCFTNFVSAFLPAPQVNPLTGAASSGCAHSGLWRLRAEGIPKRSQERGGQAVLPGSQMPQSVCRAQTLQECANIARLKPLYSQYRLEKCTKVITIMQPVLRMSEIYFPHLK